MTFADLVTPVEIFYWAPGAKSGIHLNCVTGADSAEQSIMRVGHLEKKEICSLGTPIEQFGGSRS